MSMIPQAAIEAILKFKNNHPWKGTLAERKEKFARFHDEFSAAFDLAVDIDFSHVDDNIVSGNTYIDIAQHPYVIHWHGRLSVITYLHEFAHGLYRSGNQEQAREWSYAVFRTHFPKQFAKLTFRNGMALRERRV